MEKGTSETTQPPKPSSEAVREKVPAEATKIKIQEPSFAEDQNSKGRKTVRKKSSTQSGLSRSHSSSSIASQLQSKSKYDDEGNIIDYSKPKSELSIISAPAKGTKSADEVDIVIVQVLLENPDPTWTYVYPDPATTSTQAGSKEVEKKNGKDDKASTAIGLRKSQGTKGPQSEGNEALSSQSVKIDGHDALKLDKSTLPVRISPAKRVNWLKDPEMLHEAIPEARIACFGFRPSINQNANMEYERLGKELFRSLVEMRIVHPERPLIFIGHGFGGIVVERAILETSDEHPNGLRNSVSGIIFMGTPFLGSEHAATLIRKRLSELAGTAVPSVNLLDTRYECEVLVKIRKSFIEKINDAHTSVICFVESRKTKVGSPPKEVHIIGEQGSIPGAQTIPLETDFINIGKFTSQRDRNYSMLIELLVKLWRSSQFFSAVEAAKNNQYEKLEHLLDTGCSTDILNADGRTALHEAAKARSLELARMLIGMGGASIDSKSTEGLTALHYAVEANDSKMVDYLLRKGADVNITNKDGLSALKLARKRKKRIEKKILELLRHRPLVDGPARGWLKGMTKVSPLPMGGKDVCDSFYTTLAEFYFKTPEERWFLEQPTVTDAIYEGSGPTRILDRARQKGIKENPICKWYHLPANNMAWIEDFFARLGFEDVPSPWGGQTEHRHSTHRFFRAYSYSIARSRARPITALMMPYLSYETYTSQVEMAETVDGIAKRDSQTVNLETILQQLQEELKQMLDRQRQLMESLREQPQPEFLEPRPAKVVINVKFMKEIWLKFKGWWLRCASSRDITQSDASTIPETPFTDHKTSGIDPDIEAHNESEDYSNGAVDQESEQSDSDHDSNSESESEWEAQPASNEPDVKLLEVYLNHKPPLHIRRTLDQAYYYMLPSTKSRDSQKGQVVLRYALNSNDADLKKAPKMIMVDQLWLWVVPAEPATSKTTESKAPELLSETGLLDSKAQYSEEFQIESAGTTPGGSNSRESEQIPTQTYEPKPPHVKSSNSASSESDIVISAFPRRWRQAPDDKLDLQSLRLGDPKRPPIASVSDLATLVIAQCCNIFDRSSAPKDLQFIEFFENSIGRAADEEVKLFRKFKKASDRIRFIRDKTKRAEKLDKFLDIIPETTLLEDVKDILDEINIILTVLREQKSALNTFKDRLRAVSSIGFDPGQFEKGIYMVDDNIRTFENMQIHAEGVRSALNQLLELKQKQANVWEARFAREGAVETAKQGNTLIVFTVVTIIFLPLSFLASFLALNVAQFPKGKDGTTVWSLGRVSAYLFGISIAISVPFVAFAFTINWIQKVWESLTSNLETFTKEYIATSIQKLPKTWADGAVKLRQKRKSKRHTRRKARLHEERVMVKEQVEARRKEVEELETTSSTSDSEGN